MGPSSSTTRSRSTSDRIDTPSSDMNTQPRDRGSGMFQTAGPACLLPPAGRVGVKTRQGAGGRRMSDTTPLVEAAWLARQPPGSVRIVDLRWALSGPAALDKYRAGHIPGAVYVDMEHDLSRPGGPGRHPFPAPADFARTLGRIGVQPDTQVVVYDDGSGSGAARLRVLPRAHRPQRAPRLDGRYPRSGEAGLA